MALVICYLESCRDKVLKICTPEKFRELTESQRTAMLIDAYRSGQNPDAKGQLPAFVFMGYPPEDLMGKDGSRKKSLLLPTGLVMLDYDHLSEKYGMTPHEVHDKFLKLMPSLGLTLEHDLAFSSITPSNDGFRLVLRLPRSKQIAEYQQYISDKLGMECDKAVKDISRISFVPKYEDIFYINKALLFSSTETTLSSNNSLSSNLTNLTNCSDDGNSDNKENSYNSLNSMTEKTDTRNLMTFPSTYNGIAYKRIVEELIRVHGGEPQVGNRNNMVFMLAGDLCKITDYNQTWVESLVPTFGLPEDEWRATIAGQCKKVQDRGLSMKLKEAIKNLTLALSQERGDYEDSCDNDGNLDSPSHMGEGRDGVLLPALPEKLPKLVELLTSKVLPHQRPAVSAMIFPALATHVNNALFKLSDNTDVELSMMCCLLAKQSIGKGCVKQPLHAIMADIKATDDINRQRETAWQEQQKNKKANEKGQSKPDDLVIRWLNSDSTPAAFLGRLLAAQHGNADGSDLCTYTQVDEIEDLYNFCTSGGRNRICQMIKRTWDRDMIGAERFTANAANISTILRWNWAASSTIEGGKKFFKTSLTDGTTSRVDFCTIIPPGKVIQFRYGTYDNAFRTELKPYIDNLNSFRCEKDDFGFLIPCEIPEVLALEEEMNSYINLHASTEADDTWENYAWRAKVMAVKKLIVLYLANGCKWEDTFEEFAWWSFKYSMWCKINLFYDAASVQFHEERIAGAKGNRSPLKAMKRQFSYPEFVAVCQELGFKNPRDIMYKYKQRGVVIERDKQYIVDPEYAEKFGIRQV